MSDGIRQHRHTRQRDEVTALLQESTQFLSAQRAFTLLRDRGIGIGLTTVYRILQAFADDGLVDSTRTPTGEQVYRWCSRGHHHHLMCRHCARTIEVQGPAIEQWTATLAADHGFRDVDHTIEIFGVCGTCAAGADS